jgi:hypothetical protein
MEWTFHVQYANIVAYITTPKTQHSLLNHQGELVEFLNSLQLSHDSRLMHTSKNSPPRRKPCGAFDCIR